MPFRIALSGLNAGPGEVARLMGDFKTMLMRLLAADGDFADR